MEIEVIPSTASLIQQYKKWIYEHLEARRRKEERIRLHLKYRYGIQKLSRTQLTTWWQEMLREYKKENPNKSFGKHKNPPERIFTGKASQAIP